ncbi:MAG: helix-turn-helix transcriptional regulator [Planctomycetes bacterium]|nr:helix-turn-helix transcriptional regulator [Planctomycetota bacterium]
MPANELSNGIRRLRFDHDEMTQQELARRTGVTRQTINAIEAGKYAPSLTLAFRIALAFGVGIEDVFQYIEPPAADVGPTDVDTERQSKLTGGHP